jgi:uncharacterized protein YjbI with pentapeptide repeats
MAEISRDEIIKLNAISRELNLAGVDLSGLKLNKLHLRAVNFQNANMRLIDISEAYCRDANFSRADMTSAILIKTNITDAELKNTILDNANLSNSNLASADFLGASLINANLDGVMIASVNFSEANLENSVLTSANSYRKPTGYDGRKLRFMHANLKGVDFSNSDLCDADFTGADLTSAIFDKTILTGAIFTDANLFGAKFENADFSTSTYRRFKKKTKNVENAIANYYAQLDTSTINEEEFINWISVIKDETIKNFFLNNGLNKSREINYLKNFVLSKRNFKKIDFLKNTLTDDEINQLPFSY